MDPWPASWRSLAWFSLAREAGIGAVRWAWKQVYRHDPKRKY